ncbi:hypothetical protein SDC9_110529 [bioreactor metagenome]|uniref:Spore germination protein YndE n=1 Tax=bioreactor metagenome TaxID=1076179 RepID=A0A645BF14_9ZZZZ
MFPETPSWALLLFMLAPITYASWKGAGTIGRLATLIVPGVVLTIFFFFIFGINLMDLSILKPVLADSSLIELNNGAFLTAARISEVFVFLVFAEFLPKDAKIIKAFSLGVLLFILVYLMMIIPVLTVLGPDLARHSWNPYFLFSKQIKAYDFIQRVESVSTMGWYVGVLLKLCLYNFMASYALSGIFKTKSHKGFTIALSVFTFCVALIPIVNSTTTIVILRSDMVFPWIVLPCVFVVPLLTVLVFLLKKIYKKLSAMTESG